MTLRKILLLLFISTNAFSISENMKPSLEQKLYDVEYDPFVSYEKVMVEIENLNQEHRRCLDVDIDFDGNNPISQYSLDMIRKCDIDKLCRPLDGLSSATDGESQIETGEQIFMDYVAGKCLVEGKKEINKGESLEEILGKNRYLFDHIQNAFYEGEESGLSRQDMLGSEENLFKFLRKKDFFKGFGDKYILKITKALRVQLGYTGKQLSNKQFVYLLKKSPVHLAQLDLTPQMYEALTKREDGFNELISKNLDEVKTDILKMLLKKYENHPKKDIILNKVKNIRYRKVDYFSLEEHCPLPNAMFNEVTQEIRVCPGAERKGIESLKSTLAHEIGHAIDPCSLESGGAEFYNMDKTWNDPKVKQTRIKPDESPFKSVNSCYDSFFGMNQYQGASMEASVKHLTKGLSGEEVENIAKEIPHCHPESQSGENFCDWLSSEYVAEKMRNLPSEEKRKFAFKSMNTFVQGYCEKNTDYTEKYRSVIANNMKCFPLEYHNEVPKWVTKLFKFIDGEDFDSLIDQRDPHASHGDRLKFTFLSHPDIADAFNCKEPGPYCGK